MFSVRHRMLAALCLLVLLAVAMPRPGHSTAQAQTNNLVWSQVWDNQAIVGPSMQTRSASPAINMEIADDFDVGGTIERVVVSGYRDFHAPLNPVVYGAYVRFYEWLNGHPGALQAESFLATSDSRLVYDPVRPTQFDITLPTPFPATGRHFISVQVVMDAGTLDAWYWESANSGTPRGASVFQRDNLAGGTWSSAQNSDGAFHLYGTVTAAPRIDSLSAASLDRSGRLRIFGANFGGIQGSSNVFIGGIKSFVSRWSDTVITAYVPETAALGTDPVQVVSAAGTSNTASLNVTARQPNGPARWRFQMDAMYGVPRPAVGPDGTVYAVDVSFHLYALTPSGGLKWLVNGAGNKGVDVGPDGTVYTGSEDSISAYYPDGTLKWQFVQNPRAFILLGPNVGPDGNIYAVASQGMGVLSLTPQGQLRCNVFEAYDRGIVDYQEVVFGMNGSSLQNYFVANRHFKGSTSDCGTAFTNTNDSRLQPVVGPDNTIYVGGMRYNPNGTLINSAVFPGPINNVSPADVGSNGIVYVIQNQTLLHVMNPDLTERFSANVGTLLTTPRVDPLNRMLVLGGADNYGMSGYIQATSVQNGALLWRLQLVDENGNYNAVMSAARFTPDGTTAYLTTLMFGPNQDIDPYSYVYALQLAGSPAPPTSTPTATRTPLPTLTFTPTSTSTPLPTLTFTPTITQTSTGIITITLAQYRTTTRRLSVTATSSNPNAVLKVYVTSSGALIGTLTNNGGGNYSGTFKWPTNPLNITVKSNLDGSALAIVTVR
ncbi:MAG TPA: hypothetical protein VFR47_06925 [Anaerolineales bacterium]|nr:hypothetical protein [Anaerolineales bacterium]